MLRNFIIEAIIYGLLLVIYFLLALRLLGGPLAQLFEENLTGYAFAGLGLIVTQAVLLDFVVTYILNIFGFDQGY